MNLFETIIIDIIFSIMPLLLYFFYLVFERNTEQKESDLIFDVALLSSLYLLLKCSTKYTFNPTSILLNIPLLLAFLKRRNVMIIIISFIIILFSKDYSSIPWIYFWIQYLLYGFLYTFMRHKKWDKKYFVLVFFLLKSSAFFIAYNVKEGLSIESIGIWLTLYLIFILCLCVTLQIFSKCEEISTYFINVQNQEQEKKLKLNLFRITHEIKNPIAVCKGYLDMFDVNNVEHSRKYIPIIKDEINQTLLLLQDFLSISKIRLDKDYMDMNMLVEEVMRNFYAVMKEKNIKQEMNLLDDDIYILGDYNRLTQVLVNLLKNSIEAIPSSKRGKIKITTKVEHDQFYVEVEDNGDGISEDVLEKIKEPFFTTKPNGTGLGVSLSKEIIKAHQGTLIYDSKPLIGTKVKIWLPIEN